MNGVDRTWRRGARRGVVRVSALRAVVVLLLVLAAACSRAPKGPYDPRANPDEDLQAALVKATAEKRFVLLVFGANWCPECRALEEQLQLDPLRSLLATRFVVVHVNIGNWDKNMDFVARFGKPVDNGIPSIALLDAAGDALFVSAAGELAGSRSTSAELARWLERLIETRAG